MTGSSSLLFDILICPSLFHSKTFLDWSAKFSSKFLGNYEINLNDPFQGDEKVQSLVASNFSIFLPPTTVYFYLSFQCSDAEHKTTGGKKLQVSRSIDSL